MKYAQIIFANLTRNKVRLLLTIGSFAVALFLFAFLAEVHQAFFFWANAAVADRLFVFNRATYFNTIPASYENYIRHVPGVKKVTHGSWFQGVYQDGKEAFGIFAIDPAGQREVYPEFLVPEDQWRAFLNDRQGAIVGAKTAARLHWKIGDRIPLIPTMFGGPAWEFNLVGIYRGKRPQDDETQFWLRWDYYDENVPPQMKGQVGWYVIRVESAADSVRIAKTIDAEFANAPVETTTQTESAFAANMMKQFTNIQSLILLIGSVVFFTLLLVTGNTMAIAVRERISELAVFKAIGFSDLKLFLFVVVESLLIALIGGAIGSVFVMLAIPVLAKNLSQVLPGLILSPQVLLFGLLIVVVVGVADGSLPGILAMRLRIVQGMRRV